MATDFGVNSIERFMVALLSWLAYSGNMGAPCANPLSSYRRKVACASPALG